MKELERAFGVYVSWNCARLNSGDYATLYTRSHDMTADISTKGFDDAALYARLWLLMNLYSPQQWIDNVLRPLPLLADKSSALEDPDFDKNALNSQWVIFSMSKSTKVEDKKKAIKKKPVKQKAAEFVLALPTAYPNTPRTERS